MSPESRFGRFGGREWHGYDTAQVCLNGHVITQFAGTRPERLKKFCDKCGAETIIACPKCSKSIQGYHHTGSVHGPPRKEAPAFCHESGTAFPWTEAQIAAAQRLADETAEFTPEDREQFRQSLNDMVKQTPSTPLAVNRSKKLLLKGGRLVSDGLRDILVDVLSEAVKKQIWG